MAIYWMVSYFMLLFCLFELTAINRLQEPKIKRLISYFFFVLTLVLIFFAGIRGPDSGIDDWQYLDFFNDFSRQVRISDYDTITDIYRYEKMFMLLAWIFSWFSNNSYYFLLFIAFIAVGTNACCYKKYSPLILCSLCLYSAHLFINKDMNQIRFGLSSAFAVACICTAAGRNMLWAVLFFLMSAQSHSTGWVLLLVAPFLYLKERK